MYGETEYTLRDGFPEAFTFPDNIPDFNHTSVQDKLFISCTGEELCFHAGNPVPENGCAIVFQQAIERSVQGIGNQHQGIQTGTLFTALQT